MPILSLIAKLGLDKTGFDAGMTAAGKSVGKFGTGLKSHLAGAFSAGAVIAFTKSLIDLGGEIKDTMDRLGAGAMDVQEFGLAAKLGGQGADVFARAMEKIRIAMSEGATTGKNPLSIFGITMEQLRSGDAVGTLRQLAAALENFSGSADQTKALVDVFGAKTAGGVVNMLRELRASGKQGSFLTEPEVERLDRAGDAWTVIKNNVLSVVSKLAAGGQYSLTGGYWLFPNEQGVMTTGGTSSKKKGTPFSFVEGEESEQKKKKMASLEDQLATQLEKNRVAQLTDEERLNDLLEQRLQLVKELGFALTKEAEAAIQLKIAQNAGEIIAAQGRVKAPGDKARKGFTIEESALGRIGAFTGASAQAGLGNQQMMQLEKLTKIHEALVSKGIIVKDVR